MTGSEKTRFAFLYINTFAHQHSDEKTGVAFFGQTRTCLKIHCAMKRTHQCDNNSYFLLRKYLAESSRKID